MKRERMQLDLSQSLQNTVCTGWRAGQVEGRAAGRLAAEAPRGNSALYWWASDSSLIVWLHWGLAPRMITPLFCPITGLLSREEGVKMKMNVGEGEKFTELPWRWPYKVGGGSHGNQHLDAALTIQVSIFHQCSFPNWEAMEREEKGLRYPSIHYLSRSSQKPPSWGRFSLVYVFVLWIPFV